MLRTIGAIPRFLKLYLATFKKLSYVVNLKRAKRKPRKQRKQPLFRTPVIISLGSGAGRILSHIKTESTKIAVNNSERDLRILRGVNRRLVVGDNHGGSGMNVDKGRADFNSGATKLVQLIQRASDDQGYKEIDLLPIIATLGHGFGSGSLPEALKVLRSRFPKSVLMAVAITPFHHQGVAIRERAMSALRLCKQENMAVTPISNQIAADRLNIEPQKLSYNDTYVSINEAITSLLSSLINAMSAEEGVVESIDRNDLKRIWQPPSVLIGEAKYDMETALGIQSPHDAVKKIFAERVVAATGKPTKTYPTIFIIDTGGKVSMAQVSSITETLTSEYHADTETLKPLIIERERIDTRFILIRGGVELNV